MHAAATQPQAAPAAEPGAETQLAPAAEPAHGPAAAAPQPTAADGDGILAPAELAAPVEPPAEPDAPAEPLAGGPLAAATDEAEAGAQPAAEPAPVAVQPAAEAVPVSLATEAAEQKPALVAELVAEPPKPAAEPVAVPAAEPAAAETAPGPAPAPAAATAATAATAAVPGAADAAAVPAAAPAAPADFMQPSCPEEKHAQKPTWRRGYNYNQYSKTEYLLATLTPSDCSTKRLRPPREWFDALLGSGCASFVVGGAAPDGSVVSFLLKSHAYEYVKAEYYVQGGETKRMFRTMNLQPGDGLKIQVTGKASGVPTCRLEVIPAARNPNAAAILAAAAQQAAKREARLAANPKPPKGSGGGKKRKAGQADDSEEEDFDGAGGWGAGGGRSSRQRARKQFGDDFVSGLDEAWAAAQHSDEEYNPEDDFHLGESPGGGDGRRRGGGSRSSSRPGGQQSLGAGLAGANPVVVATGEGGRNVLKIKVNRAPTLGASGRQGSVGGQGSDAGCPLRFLAGLADDVATPLGQQGPSGSGAGGTAPGQQQQQQQAAASGTGARAAPRLPEPVALLSKKLLRGEDGAVTGAACRLGWEPGTRSVLQISRRLGEYGVAHADTAAVEDYEARPAECALEVTLRLAPAAAGRVDQLEQAILALCEAL